MNNFRKFSYQSWFSKVALHRYDVFKLRKIYFKVVLFANCHFHLIHLIIQRFYSSRMSQTTQKHFFHPLLLFEFNSVSPPILKSNDFIEIGLLFEILKMIYLLSEFIIKLNDIHFLFLLNSISVSNSLIDFFLMNLNLIYFLLFMLSQIHTRSIIVDNIIYFLI